MECGLSGGCPRHQWRVTVGFSFLSMADVALRFESAQHGQHRGVGEVLVECLADFGDGGGSLIPQDRHYIKLTFSERYVHVYGCYEKISNSRNSPARCQLAN